MTGTELDIRETATAMRQIARRLPEVIELLTEIRDALNPPDIEAEEPTCQACAKLGRVVSNCPICRGTGSA